MDQIAILALSLRVLIALVCLIAAAGKLIEREGFRAFHNSLVGAGVPRSLVIPAGAAVLGAELAVAGLAPWPPTGLTGCLAGLALFGVLTAGVARAVRRGTTATCRCFGFGLGARGGRLGRIHVVRNATLTGLAAVAAIATLLAPGPVPDPAFVVLATGVAAVGTLAVLYWEDAAFVIFGVRATKDPAS